MLTWLMNFIIGMSLSGCNTASDKKPDFPVQENRNSATGDLRYDTIFAKIKMIVSRNLAIDSALIKPQSRLSEDLGAEELDFVEFILELEKEFGILIPDEFAEKFHTIDDAVVYVKEHAAGK